MQTYTQRDKVTIGIDQHEEQPAILKEWAARHNAIVSHGARYIDGQDHEAMLQIRDIESGRGDQDDYLDHLDWMKQRKTRGVLLFSASTDAARQEHEWIERLTSAALNRVMTKYAKMQAQLKVAGYSDNALLSVPMISLAAYKQQYTDLSSLKSNNEWMDDREEIPAWEQTHEDRLLSAHQIGQQIIGNNTAYRDIANIKHAAEVKLIPVTNKLKVLDEESSDLRPYKPVPLYSLKEAQAANLLAVALELEAKIVSPLKMYTGETYTWVWDSVSGETATTTLGKPFVAFWGNEEVWFEAVTTYKNGATDGDAVSAKAAVARLWNSK